MKIILSFQVQEFHLSSDQSRSILCGVLHWQKPIQNQCRGQKMKSIKSKTLTLPGPVQLQQMLGLPLQRPDDRQGLGGDTRLRLLEPEGPRQRLASTAPLHPPKQEEALHAPCSLAHQRVWDSGHVPSPVASAVSFTPGGQGTLVPNLRSQPLPPLPPVTTPACFHLNGHISVSLAGPFSSSHL